MNIVKWNYTYAPINAPTNPAKDINPFPIPLIEVG